jgi:L-iditol 2-dehydrogenase
LRTRHAGAASSALDEGDGRRHRALRLHATRDIRLDVTDAPRPRAGEVLVRVTAVGLCGSDRHWWEEGGIGDTALSTPLVLGHEIAGVVASGPGEGRRVAVDPAITCDECEPCRAGQSNLCLAVRFAGHGTIDGGLRESLAWPERHLHELPDECSDAAGALLEPLGVALHALDLAPVGPGASVAVVGCGPIGLLLIQLARLAGATWIAAVDPLEHRVKAAAGFGASAVPSNSEGGPAAHILAATGGRGVDVTFEAAGTGAAIDTAIGVARPGTRVVAVGIPSDDRIAFRASVARRKELAIIFARRTRDTYPRAIQLVASGEIDLDRLVTHRFPLEQGELAFGALETHEGIKVLVEPSRAAGVERRDDR